jgi:hypothetical protein
VLRFVDRLIYANLKTKFLPISRRRQAKSMARFGRGTSKDIAMRDLRHVLVGVEPALRSHSKRP